MSLGDLLNDGMLDDLHFDPENFAAGVFNDQMQEPIQYEEIPAEEEIILEPVDEIILEPVEPAAVPIEEEPPAEDQIEPEIGESFTIHILNDQFKSEEEEMEEVLDAALDRIDNAPASPPDISTFIQMEEPCTFRRDKIIENILVLFLSFGLLSSENL